MRFELFIATRYLKAKRRQAFIGVITAISVLGVAAGVASLIVALAINNGFRQDLQQRLLGSTSHVSLLRVQSDGIKDWPALISRLRNEPHVVAAAPAIYEQVLISRGPRARGAILKGMIPADERKVSDLLSTVKIGSAGALEENAATPSHAIQSAPADRGNPTTDSADKNARPAQNQTSAGKGADATPDEADSMAAVQKRIAAMAPIVLGKDMADEMGATVGSEGLVTRPQGGRAPSGIGP